MLLYGLYTLWFMHNGLTCSDCVRLNVTVNVETAIHQYEELSDPLTTLEEMEMTTTVRVRMGGGRH